MMQVSRRHFLKTSTTLAAGLFFGDSLIESFKKKQRLALQLWSVRDEMKKDVRSTIKRVSAIGFKDVEGFGYDKGKIFDMTPKSFSTLLADNGLRMPSSHYVVTSNDISDTGVVTKEFAKLVEHSLSMGQKYLISPWVIDADRKDADTLKAFVAKLDKVGEYCRKQGIQFGYHNHWFEFDKIGDELMYETLLKGTDPKNVVFEMDVCWVTQMNQDPVEWLNNYAGRFELLHMKDLKSKDKRETAIIGEGIVNFDDILSNSKGIKHFIVELEHYKGNSLDDVTVAFKNLQAKF